MFIQLFWEVILMMKCKNKITTSFDAFRLFHKWASEQETNNLASSLHSEVDVLWLLIERCNYSYCFIVKIHTTTHFTGFYDSFFMGLGKCLNRWHHWLWCNGPDSYPSFFTKQYDMMTSCFPKDFFTVEWPSHGKDAITQESPPLYFSEIVWDPCNQVIQWVKKPTFSIDDGM